MENRDQEGYDDEASEQTPLVQQQHHQPRRPPHRPMLSVASIASAASHVNVPKAHDGSTIVALFCGILLVVSCANGFANIPLTKIVESALCDAYYDEAQGLGRPSFDEKCKIPEIQSKMAYIFATVEICDAIAGVVAAFPWGMAADRLGRRPVAAIALVGLAIGVFWIMTILWFSNIFPVIMITTGSLWRFLGGGNAVLVAILLSMISDVIPEDKRAAAFMRIHVSNLVGSLVSPALSSAMMSVTGPWPVMFVAIGCILVGAVAFMFVPETMQHKQSEPANDDDTDGPKGLKGHLDHTIAQLKNSMSMLKSPSVILLLLTCLGTYPITEATAQFLVQFTSKRYSIPIESTGYVQSSFGIFQVIQALLILPWLSNFLLRDKTPAFLRMPNEQVRDLAISRWSFGLLAFAFFVMAIAPTLWMFVAGLVIMALGSAATSVIRSLMSLYVDTEHRSRLYSLVGIVDTVGGLYGPPMLAGLFSLGMKYGGVWIGLPYLGMTAIATIMVTLLFFVRVPKQSREEPPSSEEGRTHQD